MMSLATAKPLPDYKGTLALIQRGGKKAAGMKPILLVKSFSISLFILLISLAEGKGGDLSFCPPRHLQTFKQDTLRYLGCGALDLKWKRAVTSEH